MRRAGGQTGLPDPFALHNSLLNNFFAEDPFDDPFFRQPFGGMLGPSPFDSMFPRRSSLLTPEPFGLFQSPFQLPHPAQPFQQQQQQSQPRQPQRLPAQNRAPIIVEVEEQDVLNSQQKLHPSSRKDEPIVEHPDEEENGEVRQQQQKAPQNSAVTPQFPWGLPGSSGNGTSSHNYQSFSYSYSGIGGQKYYSSSSTRKQGSNGVFEEQHEAQDSSGKMDMRLTRGLGEKGRTLARSRDSTGTDHSAEYLHNLSQEEARTFDQTWQQRAGQLPLFGSSGNKRNTAGPLQLGPAPGSARERPALPEVSPTRRRRIEQPQANIRYA